MENQVDLSTLYTPHEWDVKEGVTRDEFLRMVEETEESDLIIWSSDSERAQKYFKQYKNIENIFFIDMEEIMMGFETLYGPHSLRNNSEGKLLLFLYKGAGNGTFTVATEK